MTYMQKEYIKKLLEQESEFGLFNCSFDAIKKLGGLEWEKNYENISHNTTSEVIKMLNDSLHQSKWAWNNGYV